MPAETKLMSGIGRAWAPPPISALRAFEATARLLSFTRAAEELHVTQSAASHGVRELESRVGARLLDRDGRRLTLSDAGRLYLPFVTSALERLRAGDTALRAPEQRARILTVSVSPSFATKWLVPRLGEFSVEHPDLDLRISAVAQHVDLSEGEIDLAVRHGNGSWPGLHATRLCSEMLFPVCNPNFLKQTPLRTPADLLQHTLIHHRDEEAWRKWLQGFGVDCGAGTMHGACIQ
jgi:LysR family transcriptional regulator, glycine cleavage system transcriptional activator